MKFGGGNTWRNLKYRQNVSLRSAFGDYCDPLQSLRRTAVLRKVLPRIQLHHLPLAPRRLQRRSFIVNHILYIIDLYTICIRQHPLYFHWCRGGTTFLKSLGINGGLSWSSRTHGNSDNGNSSKNGGVGGVTYTRCSLTSCVYHNGDRLLLRRVAADHWPCCFGILLPTCRHSTTIAYRLRHTKKEESCQKPCTFIIVCMLLHQSCINPASNNSCEIVCIASTCWVVQAKVHIDGEA